MKGDQQATNERKSNNSQAPCPYLYKSDIEKEAKKAKHVTFGKNSEKLPIASMPFSLAMQWTDRSEANVITYS